MYMIGNGVILLLFVSICFHHQAFLNIFAQKIDRRDHHRHAVDQNDQQFIIDLIRLNALVKE